MAAFSTIATIGLGVASVGSSVKAANEQGELSGKQQKFLKRQSKFQREANRIQTNEELTLSYAQRRALSREERLRRATLIVGAGASGVTGSSSAIAAAGAIGSSFAAARATQRQSVKSSLAVSKAQQKAANQATKAGFIQSEREKASLNEQANQSLFRTGIKLVNSF